jgi:hypothetical protein
MIALFLAVVSPSKAIQRPKSKGRRINLNIYFTLGCCNDVQ